MRIYVASSWKNKKQQEVVSFLKEKGYEVYDFMNPGPGKKGFQWEELDPDWKKWSAIDFMNNVSTNKIALDAFDLDYSAMRNADACVMVLPCGRSAHLEAGYFVGANKRLIILMDSDEVVPELMYLMAGFITTDLELVHTELSGMDNHADGSATGKPSGTVEVVS